MRLRSASNWPEVGWPFSALPLWLLLAISGTFARFQFQPVASISRCCNLEIIINLMLAI